MADVRLAQVDEHPFGISWVIDEAGSRASHALKVEGQVYVIDPVEHEAALERIEVLGPVAAVVQLLDRHNRDCAAIARKLGVPHLRMPEAIPNTPLETINVVDLRRWREVALWWPRRELLVVAEALGTASLWTADHGVVGLHPILRPLPPKALRAYRPAHLLTGHGPPVSGPDARDGVEWAYDHARGDLPRLGAMFVRMALDAVRKR